MAITTNSYTGDGSTTVYSISFPYVKTADVKATLDGSATTAFTVSGTNLTFTSAPADGVAIKLFRETNNETILSSFQSGSALRAVDMNTNFTQSLYVSQETTTAADSAVTTANSAVTTANSAVTTANAASATANTASTDASSAVTTANAASATANTASTDASAAVTTANTASTNASAAVTTANSADTKADDAVSTANTAATNASNAVSTANTANTTANSAVSTANTASTNASNAVTTANNAQTAVTNAAIFAIVNNVAAIPGSPSNQDKIEITDSTGVQSSSVVTGLPVGFAGDSGLFVRLEYLTSNSKWNYVQYGANDIDSRYLKQSTSKTISFTGDATGSYAFTGSGAHSCALTVADDSHNHIISNVDGLQDALDLKVAKDSSGNVVITGSTCIGGTTITDSNLLNIQGSSASNNIGVVLNDTNTSKIYGIQNTGSTFKVFDYTASKNRFTITSNGNIGINTDSPQQQAGIGLHIHNPDNQARIKITQSGSGATANDGFDIIAETGNEIHLINHESAAMKFGVVSERMRIDSSGRLLVGTSTYTGNGQVAIAGNSNNSAAAGILDIRPTLSRPTAANTTLSLIRFGGADHTSNTGYASINMASDGASASDSDLPGRLEFHTTNDGASSPTEKMRIASSGLISAPGVYSFTTASSANVIVESAGQLSRATSSIKYKRNVETLEDSYADAILNCRPVWYQSKSELDNPDHGFWGFIAEEVAEIDPRLVQWKTNEITYDENGSSVATPCEPEAESVAYDRFVPHLLNIVKRQQATIESLETRIAALE